MPSTDKKRWKRTNDVRGHERNWTHTCSSCGHDKMILRSSLVVPASVQVIPGNDRKRFMEDPCNIVRFKCEQCSLVDKFIIDETKEYIDEILELRDGVPLYTPSREEWGAEGDEEIKKRLKDLGYI